jgi:hypothetical protein
LVLPVFFKFPHVCPPLDGYFILFLASKEDAFSDNLKKINKIGAWLKSGMVYNLDANIHKTEGKHAISSRCLDRMEVNYVTGT